MEKQVQAIVSFCQLVVGFIVMHQATISTTVLAAPDLKWCSKALGMQSGGISDSSLSASSAFDGPSVGPQHARLQHDKSGGAWCPKPQVAEGVVEFLQIDLGHVMRISGIATQGRYGGGRGQEYAEAYRLEYWRPNFRSWRRYKSRSGQEILEGNSDTNTVVHRDLNPPIFAARLRVIPYGIYPRTVCMRVELYGCRFAEDIASYAMPASSLHSSEFAFNDATYDGDSHANVLQNGLGMLTDGIYGLEHIKTDFALSHDGWVGWKNDSFGNRPVEVLFEFGQVRNFSAVTLYMNNHFTKGIKVFSKAKISFSVYGRTFPKSVAYVYMPDLALEASRNVTVKVPHICGRFVQLKLWFAAQWLLIGEVAFESVPVIGNITEQEGDVDEEILVTPVLNDSELLEAETADVSSRGYYEAVVGALSAVMLLLLLAVLVILLLNRRKKLHEANDTLKNQYSVSVNMNDLLKDIETHEEGKIRADGECKRVKEQRIGQLEPQVEPCLMYTSLSGGSYVEKYQSSSVVNLDHYFPRVASEPLTRKRHLKTGSLNSNASSKTQISHQWNIRPVMDIAEDESKGVSVPEIPRQVLRLVEWLGTCKYGEAYICNIMGEGDYANTHSNLVLVRGGAYGRLQRNKTFQSEAKRLASLKHENIAALVATSSSETSAWAIFECPPFGDLKSYLQKASPHGTQAGAGHQHLGYDSLLYIATQISDAMEYLQSRGLTHKDLAARNCYVGANLLIKVTDTAMVAAAYRDDYGEVRGRKPLPLRWLPWETLVLNKFSFASAVWSYAVTLWEIFSFGRKTPFEHLSDAQVILNADHYYYMDGLHATLTKPSLCCPELYEVMTHCWERDESLRPAFLDIGLTLRQISTSFVRRDIGQT